MIDGIQYWKDGVFISIGINGACSGKRKLKIVTKKFLNQMSIEKIRFVMPREKGGSCNAKDRRFAAILHRNGKGLPVDKMIKKKRRINRGPSGG
jgi:hypothetical protein